MIVGITGRIGSGKSTVADIVKELYPEMNWQIKGFADKLRQMASLLTGIPSDRMKEQEVKEQLLGDEWANPLGEGYIYRDKITLRTLLQRLGTEAIRDGLHKNAWVNALMRQYAPRGIVFKPGGPENGEPGPLPNWLVADTRFLNEYQAIIDKGGTCVRIIRPDNPYPQSDHPSETSLGCIELLTIVNDGNLDQLKSTTKEVFDQIVKNAATSN